MNTLVRSQPSPIFSASGFQRFAATLTAVFLPWPLTIFTSINEMNTSNFEKSLMEVVQQRDRLSIPERIHLLDEHITSLEKVFLPTESQSEPCFALGSSNDLFIFYFG